ncbi:thiopeptide-type bacteriocin biosynthesis protein [Candidatus Pantoea multigeneris]|uniref:Thiopeptide-type bacteriocin biosynthesis domain-containing protein n=1 Tax=Candidatus Pantoea multigeneris TaxID=2608357 RepID=A0ABX0R7W5_9GAMM|nr:thiopeptide-type bacteriocin biosynthesis protein [Pantoea multigeneris]NIF20366.1 hypothetical protein [Pantoea multigeneris]
MLNSREWVYYKLYVGQRHDVLDYVIVDILNKIDSLLLNHPWFYLRYIDENGTHLRLRIQLPVGQKSLDTEIFSLLHDGMTEVDTAPYNTYEPLISITGHSEPLHTGPQFSAFCIKDDYVPEYDKYGGEEGIAIAERVFSQSSILARKIIKHERQGDLNRKDLVLPLFLTGLQVFIKPENRQVFLTRYATFWLSGNPAIGSLKMAFAEQAYNLLDAGEELVPGLSSLSVTEQHLIQTWREHLAQGRDDYIKKAGQFPKDILELIAFHFIHLMNNRLGFNTLEEAYIATLLATAEESGYHYELA